jgi:hypothetical protein
MVRRRRPASPAGTSTSSARGRTAYVTGWVPAPHRKQVSRFPMPYGERSAGNLVQPIDVLEDILTDAGSPRRLLADLHEPIAQ